MTSALVPRPSLSRLSAIAAGWIASNILWALVGPGLGLVVGAVLTALVDIGQPWRTWFFVGCLMVGTGLVVGIVRPLTVGRLPHPPPAPPPSAAEIALAEANAARAREDEKRQRRYRVIAQEAITTLEFQRGVLTENRFAFSPQHQGAWPQNRNELFEEERYANAGRLTETAFIELQKVPATYNANADASAARAVAAIDAAVLALEAVAGIER